MADIKFTTNELRAQQKHLGQLERYLPTLQLKKAMLQAEIYDAKLEIEGCERDLAELYAKVEEYCVLLSARSHVDLAQLANVTDVEKRYDNIAGVEVPYFESITFEKVEYSLYDTPPWLENVIAGLRAVATARAQVVVAEEKKEALEKELRLVSIRVNLFEKVLIPRALRNIKKIKVFLGDQELAAVSRAKVAKTKIEKRRGAHAL
ncbi:MAG: V-type ATP synthase subunit D [Waddliaceae bacterium]